jgi:hypothetical protein
MQNEIAPNEAQTNLTQQKMRVLHHRLAQASLRAHTLLYVYLK